MIHFWKSWRQRLLEYLILIDDSPSDVFRKNLYVSLILFWVINCIASVIYPKTSDMTIYIAVVLLMILSSIGTLTFILLKYKSIDDTSVVVSCFIMIAIIVIWDFVSGSQTATERWPAVIVVVDVIVLTKPSSKFNERHVVITLIIWLGISTLERILRLGLFDIPGTTSTADRFNKLCSCSIPPCGEAVGDGISRWVFAVSVILFNYSFKFSKTHEDDEEPTVFTKEQLSAAIITSTDIAELLADFNLDNATSLLQSDCNLPFELHEAFAAINATLETIRPFLPETLFEFHDHNDTISLRAQTPQRRPKPLGLDAGNAAVLFTDVKSSTHLWECFPNIMPKVLKLHNSLIRNVLHSYGGYEVKTIGDSFMIAFENFTKGAQFGLEVLQKLPGQNWPLELLDEYPTGVLLRIGLFEGPVTIELNTMTTTYDYFGNTVNMASRLESNGTVAAVTVTEDQLNHYVKEMDICDYSSRCLGSKILKGIREGQNLVSLYPIGTSPKSTSISGETTRSVISEGKMSIASLSDSRCKSRRPRGNAIIGRKPDGNMQSHQTCTIATVEVMGVLNPPVVSEIQEIVAQLMCAASKTQGGIHSLCGVTLTVGWNTGTNCSYHLENALEFSKIITINSVAASVGVSNGPIVLSSVGNDRKRFLTPVGPCVRLSSELCAKAIDLGASILYASAGELTSCATRSPHLKELLRPIDCWSLCLGTDSSSILEVGIYEFIFIPVDGRGDVSFLLKESGPEYWEAFDSSDEARMASLIMTGDYVAELVVKMFRSSESLRPPLSLYISNNERIPALAKRSSPKSEACTNELIKKSSFSRVVEKSII